MKTYEKQLKLIQCMSLTDSLIYAPNLDMSESDLLFLKAKGLVKFKSAGDNERYIILTDSGITYFDDKRIERNSLILHWSMNFAIAIMSAIFGSAITLFVQYALM